MAMLEFRLTLRIPEDPTGTLILGSDGEGIKLPTALVSKIPAIRDGIRFLKSFSTDTNVGADNEEMTTEATIRIVRHDEDSNIPDGAKIEI